MTARGIPLVLALLTTVAAAAAAESIPFDSERWEIRASEWRVEEHLGRPSLYLKDGEAWIDGLEIADGEISFDIAFTPERGFAGAVFRVQDLGNYEHLYLRPHQSGQPDANQYTPVFDSASAWQLYHGPSYATALPYRFDRWMSVRIVYVGGRADVWIDSEDPVLAVELKRATEAGSAGISSFLAETWFSDFRVRTASADDLVGSPVPEPPAPDGAVTRWEVSTPFAESQLEGVRDLDDADLPALEWRGLPAESTGIVNLASLGGFSDETNTVLARFTVTADSAGPRRIRFGYSDRVRAFVNGRLIYDGSNRYRSRDYRYLGTIGLFDAIWAPLESGDNAIVFAVSEDFGGWGVMATVEPAG